MKKIVIAGASMALAAMPVLGAFAVEGTSFTDSLTVTIQDGCTIQNSQDAGTAGVYTNSDRSFTKTIAAGNVGYLNATDAGVPETTEGTVTVTCNSGSTSTKTFSVAVAVDGLTSGSNTIAGGVATSGATSNWAIKSNATGASTDNFSNYAKAESKVFLTGEAKNTLTFNPTYRVYVSPTQVPGSYTGSATYTVTINN